MGLDNAQTSFEHYRDHTDWTCAVDAPKRQIIQSKVGELHAEKLEAVVDRLITILRR